MDIPRLGKRPPRYTLFLNPYSDARFTKDEIESLLARLFQRLDTQVTGNDYLVIGTLDRAEWKQGVSGKIVLQDMIEALHDFKDVVQFGLAGRWGFKKT